VTDTSAELSGTHFSVSSGKDSNGGSLPVIRTGEDYGADVAKCWREGICPCCGLPTLGKSNV
jgi:hypothetical protein